MRHDRRKYRNQMDDGEIEFIENLIHEQAQWVIGPHARTRMAAKRVREEELLDVLKTGRVVEVNEVNDLCALFRKDYGSHGVCVVVAIANRWVVTVWKNEARDRHRTLDQSKYKWNEDIRNVMAGFVSG